MQTLLNIVRFIWDSFFKLGAWFVGLPGLIISATVGLITSVEVIIRQLTQGSDMTNALVSVSADSASAMYDMVNSMPDIYKLGVYVLSLDVLFDWFTTFLGIFYSLVVVLLTFSLIAIPAWILNWYLFKLTTWFASAIVPESWRPAFVVSITKPNFKLRSGETVAMSTDLD